MEYCGEVCSLEEFETRRNIYEKESRRHYYFMSLKTDEVYCYFIIIIIDFIKDT